MKYHRSCIQFGVMEVIKVNVVGGKVMVPVPWTFVLLLLLLLVNL